MKSIIKTFLYKNDWYYPIRYSRLFRLYQYLFKPGDIKEEKREIDFYRSLLSTCNLVFDIGAHDGHKTAALLAIADKIVCCEPDRQNFRLLQARFRKRKKRVILVNKAVSDKTGIARLHVHHPGSAFNTLSPKWVKLLEADNMERWDEKIKFGEVQEIETTTLDQLISEYGVPGFIKIDTEGFEEFVLKGLTHRIPYLSFETLLPDYSAELDSCLGCISYLDPSVTWNIALHEKLVFRDFISTTELKKWLNINSKGPSFEVIAKMSL